MSDAYLLPASRRKSVAETGLLTAALISLTALGCDDASPKAGHSGPSASAARPSASAASKADPEGCPKRVEQWTQRLGQLQREGAFIRPTDTITLARLAVPPTPPREAITLSLDADGALLVDGVARQADLDLREELKAKRQKIVEANTALGGRAGLDPSVITFEVDRRAPWPKVVRLVGVARETGFSRAGFRFAAKSTLRLPAASKAREDYEKRAGVGAAGKVPARTPAPVSAKVLFRSCPAAQATMKQLAAKPSVDRQAQSRRLWGGLPKAVLACDCNLPWPALEAWVWAHFGRFRGAATTTIDLGLRGTAPVRVAMPADAIWSQAAAKVAAAAEKGTAARLEVGAAAP